MNIFIDHKTLLGIHLYLEQSYPYEACGFLIGTDQHTKRYITGFIPVENKSTDNQKRRFVIDPIDYLNAEKFALREGLNLLGIYHSHPDHPAFPSIHDLEYAQPYFSYFISGIESGKHTATRSFHLTDGKFEEEKISVLRTHRAKLAS